MLSIFKNEKDTTQMCIKQFNANCLWERIFLLWYSFAICLNLFNFSQDIFYFIQVKSCMRLDILVKQWQTNIFNSCLLTYSIFVRLKVGATLNVTSQHLLSNFSIESESWGTVQESTENQNILKWGKMIIFQCIWAARHYYLWSTINN